MDLAMNADGLTLPSLVETYLTRCAVEGKSPQTLRSYGETLRRFCRILRADGAPLDPAALRPSGPTTSSPTSPATRPTAWTPATATSARSAASSAGCAPPGTWRTIRSAASATSASPHKIVQPFTPVDIAALLAACLPHTPAGRRDAAIVLTLLDTGVRCSELVLLDLGDCDLAAQRLRIRHGKGNKQRVVPFAARCRTALQAYLADRGRDPGPLFVQAVSTGALRPGKGLDANALKHLLRRLGRRAGVRKVHAHRFRHTFATWAIEHDARELDVQYLLGHSSPDMVRRYSATYGVEQAAQRHGRFSPADQMLPTPTDRSRRRRGGTAPSLCFP